MRLLLILATLMSGFTIAAQNPHRDYYQITAGPVSEVLLDLAIDKNLNLIFLSDQASRINTNALDGNYTLTEALDQLLKHTQLKAIVSNNRMIQIQRVKPPRPPRHKYQPAKVLTQKPLVPPTQPSNAELENTEPTIEEIEVIAKLVSPYNLGVTVSSTKTQQYFLDTPQIVAALPEQLISDIGARNYADSITLTSSVSYLERSAGVADELRLRGFAYPALKINGMGSHAYIAPVDIAFINNIEVAKGPSSVLFGRMEPGGMVNMMLKGANESHNSVELRLGSDNFQRVTADYSTDVDDSTYLRGIGFLQQSGKKADSNLDDSAGFMFTLLHDFSFGGTLQAHYRYEEQNVLQKFGRPLEAFEPEVEFFRNEEGGIDIINNQQEDLSAGLDVKRHSFFVMANDILFRSWSADAMFQYDNYRADSSIVYPVFDNFILDIDDETISSDTLTEELLEDPEFVSELLAGLETITIDPDGVRFSEQPFSYNTEFFSSELTLYHNRAFDYLTVEQLYGVNVNHSSPETLIWQNHDTRSNFIPTGQIEVIFNAEDTDTQVTDTNIGGFAQWTITWRDWTLFAGARLDYLRFNATSPVADNKATFFQTTSRAGLVYNFLPSTSVFVNYSESFSPQFALNEHNFTDTGSPLDDEEYSVALPTPADSEQVELGIKHLAFNNKLQTSCAIYRIEKSGIVGDIQAQETRGAECDVQGSLNPTWHLTFSANYLDSTITQADHEDIIGLTPRMTPKKSVRVWLTKALPQTMWPTQLGVGFNYVDTRYITAQNEDALPDYSLIDVRVNSQITPHLQASLLITNLLDEAYIEGAFNALPLWTNPGPGRVFEARIAYQF